MSNRATALAEAFFSQHHKQAWPRQLYAYDRDELRSSDGERIYLEAPAGTLAAAVEYKPVEAGPLDLSDLQFRLVGDHAERTPAFVAQFSHPRLSPPQPWCFRLYPLNDAARGIGQVEFTEVAYIQFLYLLSRGTADAGGQLVPASHVERSKERSTFWRNLGLDPSAREWRTSAGIRFTPRPEFGHLDHERADPVVWPPVTPAKPRRFRPPVMTDPRVVREYIAQMGHLIGPADESQRAPVVTIDRKALGAYRAPAPAPAVEIANRSSLAVEPEPAVERRIVPERRPLRDRPWSAEDADRYERLRWQLDRDYKAARDQLGEGPSEERDTWRAWNADGSSRWPRVRP